MLPARGAAWGGGRDVGGMREAGLCTRASRRRKKGAARAFPINGGRRGGAAHLLDGAEAWSFKAPTPFNHGTGRSHLTRCFGPARSPRGAHAPGVAVGEGGKPGRRGLGRRIGPGLLRHSRLHWRNGAVEPPPCSFIKSGGVGALHSSISLLQLLLPSLSFAMETGNPGPSTVATRVAARQRVPPSPAPAVAEPAARGRGRGRGARGR